MTELFLILLGLLLLIGAMKFLQYLLATKDGVVTTLEELPYRLKPHFFTRSEYVFFQTLTDTLESEKYRIFPKVRLGDYIEPTNGGRARYGSWARIRSRHIDFLIWDNQKGQPVLAIELDGKSHASTSAREMDGFKDRLFLAIGLPLQRVSVGSDFAAEAAAIHKHLTEPQQPTED